MTTLEILRPSEVFPTWRRAQLVVDQHAYELPPSPHVLRTTGQLEPEHAARVTDWFLTAPAPPVEAVAHAYRALERDTRRLFALVRNLGVRVVHVDADPGVSAAELCSDVRDHGLLTLTRDEPHPLFGAFDELRALHDVFGHAALGLGFDLQSEFATWLQCRTLFSSAARPAAFCELVGAVTAYVSTGVKPGLRAKLPPAGWA
ncbi:hypothetical protein DVA67_006860 [Solirubrobacter sp. CPCC 204708]|uniref:Uncharacterized protein n=1 Tax=Solirubrobacter deserti TaxID=2282478 RepID=A0ABT4RT26_9ACTN|nr:hypothetical protein [Solirubrobacter deserti]MBE2315688.1 hypothetical protein [Solirubrobacter deserti]MDA0141734.1 hypothetical protein [Solirubrobacter deserti]